MIEKRIWPTSPSSISVKIFSGFSFARVPWRAVYTDFFTAASADLDEEQTFNGGVIDIKSWSTNPKMTHFQIYIRDDGRVSSLYWRSARKVICNIHSLARSHYLGLVK